MEPLLFALAEPPLSKLPPFCLRCLPSYALRPTWKEGSNRSSQSLRGNFEMCRNFQLARALQKLGFKRLEARRGGLLLHVKGAVNRQRSYRLETRRALLSFLPQCQGILWRRPTAVPAPLTKRPKRPISVTILEKRFEAGPGEIRLPAACQGLS